MVFPVVMYGCESWTRKKAERWRIDAFELWCSRKLLRVPWTAMRSNQSILKEINPEYSLVGLMLHLKFQHFGHLMQTANSLEKTLMLERLKAGGQGDDRGRDGWIASLMQWTWTQANSGRRWGTEGLVCCSPWSRKELDTSGRLNNKQHDVIKEALHLHGILSQNSQSSLTMKRESRETHSGGWSTKYATSAAKTIKVMKNKHD